VIAAIRRKYSPHAPPTRQSMASVTEYRERHRGPERRGNCRLKESSVELYGVGRGGALHGSKQTGKIRAAHST